MPENVAVVLIVFPAGPCSIHLTERSCSPSCGPSVQVTFASPDASVVEDVALTAPAPGATDQATSSPGADRGLHLASPGVTEVRTTISFGSEVPARPSCPLPDLSVNS